MIGSKLSGFLLLALLLTVPVTSQARAYYNNPFGVYVNGWVMDYQTNCSHPCQQINYNQGDFYGSGSLTPYADTNTSVLGAYSRSYGSVPGNQLLLTANSDVPAPFDGTLETALASAEVRMWDTVTFAGATAGELGTFTFKANILNNSIWGNGDIVIEATNTAEYGGYEYENDFLIPGGMSGRVTLSMTVHLDAGPIQFVTFADIYSSSGGGSSDISLDPGWSFSLPSGVTLASSGGADYPVNVPAPEPGTLSVLTLGITALGGLKRKFLI